MFSWRVVNGKCEYEGEWDFEGSVCICLILTKWGIVLILRLLSVLYKDSDMCMVRGTNIWSYSQKLFVFIFYFFVSKKCLLYPFICWFNYVCDVNIFNSNLGL